MRGMRGMMREGMRDEQNSSDTYGTRYMYVYTYMQCTVRTSVSFNYNASYM